MKRLFANAYVVVMDDAGSEHESGWLLVEGGVVAATGSGSEPEADERVDLARALVTPGLVNTHHHLNQTLTRARAQEADLFTWLKTLYPVWARIDAEAEHAAARTGLAELALAGCTTVFDHHYVFPRGAGDLIEAEMTAADELGVRLVPSRGSMDLGESDGGLPPDSIVEELDDVLAETERLADKHPDLVVAPCSPFSVTGKLMEESAELARRRGLQLHTHLAETAEEETYCQQLYGCRPVEYLERLGWLDGDVWCAHCVHLSDEDVQRFGETGTGVAHCPRSNGALGCGVAPLAELRAAGARVGVGTDSPASAPSFDFFEELRSVVLTARARAARPDVLSAAEALELGTLGSARALGLDAEVGSLVVGKRADIAVVSLAGSPYLPWEDPAAAVVFGGSPDRVIATYVDGEARYEKGGMDWQELTAAAHSARRAMLAQPAAKPVPAANPVPAAKPVAAPRA